MKKNSIFRCQICHDVIETQHVYSENNQVYLKNHSINKNNAARTEEWFPINFQWKSDLELRNTLIQQS